MMNEEKMLEMVASSGIELSLKQEDFSKPFKDIGLDSLDVFNLLVEIESICGEKISDDDFQHLNTLADLIAYLNK